MNSCYYKVSAKVFYIKMGDNNAFLSLKWSLTFRWSSNLWVCLSYAAISICKNYTFIIDVIFVPFLVIFKCYVFFEVWYTDNVNVTLKFCVFFVLLRELSVRLIKAATRCPCSDLVWPSNTLSVSSLCWRHYQATGFNGRMSLQAFQGNCYTQFKLLSHNRLWSFLFLFVLLLL